LTTATPSGMTWRSGDARHRLDLTEFRDAVDPEFLPKLNSVLPAGPRFFNVDTGGQMMLIVRATEAERKYLQDARPVRLHPEAPGWWRDG